jgi:hypothetical protein
MKRHTWAALSAATLGFTVAAAFAQQKDERAGNCDQARSQMEYFCGGGGDPNDMMMQFTACDNAKKNVAAACEGKVEADKAYQFENK